MTIVIDNVEKTLRGILSDVKTLAFSQDSSLLASTSRDKTVRFWNVPTGKTWKSKDCTGGYWNIWDRMVWSQDGKLLATLHTDETKHTVHLWDIAKGKPKGRPLLHSSSKQFRGYCTASFSPDGTFMSLLNGGVMHMWNVDKGECLWRFDNKSLNWASFYNSGIFSPDGDCIALAIKENNAILLFDANEGKVLKTLNGHESAVARLAFSPCGRFLVSASIDKTVNLWSVETGKTEHRLYGNGESILNIAWTKPDQIVINSENNPLAIWERLTIHDKPQWCPVHLSEGSEDLFAQGLTFRRRNDPEQAGQAFLKAKSSDKIAGGLSPKKTGIIEENKKLYECNKRQC